MRSVSKTRKPAQSKSAVRTTLNLRIKPEEQGLIDRAAKARGKNRTEFILNAARLAAEEAILDQTTLIVSEQAYAKFLDELDKPPRVNARLRKTMQTPAPWDNI